MFVGETQLTVDGGEDTLHLSESEHTAKEGVAGIVTVARLIHDAARLIGESHTVIYTHRKLRILFLKYLAEFYDVGTSTQMAGFSEVTIGEDVT